MRYNTKSQITTDDKSESAVLEKTQIGKNTQEDGPAETHKHPKVVSPSKHEGSENETSSPSKQNEANQHSHSSGTYPYSEEELVEGMTAISEALEVAEIYKATLTEINNLRTTHLKEQKEQTYATANWLNSLSAEEQQAYFQDFRDKVDELSNLMRTSILGDADVSDNYKQYTFKMFESVLSNKETLVNNYIEELRSHGFEPKF